MDSLELDGLISWVVQRLSSIEISVESTSEDLKAIIEFVSGDLPKILTIHKNEEQYFIACDDNLKMNVQIDGVLMPLYAYFIRSSSGYLSGKTVEKEVQYGTVGSKGLSMSAFERVMKGLVEKSLAHNASLTESARNELQGHFHRCMATLTDAMYFKSNRTVLYCPTFDFSNISEAASNKDRMQIMESIVIHWTRQIKDVINNHDSLSSSETSGALVEIDFWKDRAQNLLGIQGQLESASVVKILQVLQYAKSNYIGPFETLTRQIVSRAAEANDNLRFLETIRAQCVHLREIEADKIVTILPELLSKIRLIWSFSKYYNTEDRVSGLLRKISNEIITRFRNHVSLHEILDGDVDFSIVRLNESIQCGVKWKELYHKTKASIAAQKERYGR
jgi:dynein heavy chain